MRASPGRESGPARSGTALVLAGLVLAVVGGTFLLAPGRALVADAGSVVDPATPSRSAESATSAASAPAPAPSPRSEPSTPPAPAGFVPQRLVVKVLGIDAALDATTVDPVGALVPPDDPARLGWWRGVRPGDGAGSVIVAGHIDSRRYGRGPLARIVDLAPGDTAVVAGPDGMSATYVVRGVEAFPKSELPAGTLFDRAGPERLVLVTCGGTFDRARGSWDSNIVAVLDPAPGS